VLIEDAAYGNRWRRVSPAAKAVFALAGLAAAFAAATPRAGLGVSLALVAATVFGARVPAGRYLRVAAPALFFLALSGLSLVFSLQPDGVGGGLAFRATAAGLESFATVGSRSLGALAAMLFLVLTTPLLDIMGLLRRCRTPEVLLEIMVLCYRSLFVFAAAVQDTRTAQAARLGYGSPRLALRSLGQLVANLTLQVWQRAQTLHGAALARNNDGPLRFLPASFAHGRRDVAAAAAAGVALIALARGMA